MPKGAPYRLLYRLRGSLMGFQGSEHRRLQSVLVPVSQVLAPRSEGALDWKKEDRFV